MKKYASNTVAGFLCSFVLFNACSNQKEEIKPNLVFIFSDQQAYDMLGCYGNEQIKTPNLDHFASEGVRFTNCFSNSPISTPFRGMLLSGQHSLYNGCFVNDKPLIPGNGKKFAEVLRDDGYSTAYIGKWHLLGGDRDRPIPEGEMRYGFDELFYSNNCHVDFRPGNCFYWNEEGKKVFFEDWEVYGQTSQALEYLDSRKDSENPFAMFVSWHPPHDWGKFEGEDGEMHYKYDAPEDLMSLYNRDSIKLRPGMKSTADLRRMYHGHMAMVSGVDIAFGQLMDKLTELGLDDNTLVVFTSDHGDMLEFNDAILPKQYPHDYSLHIPYIMRWPDHLKSGTSTDLLYGALDMMPSILGLMGLSVPQECHGKNLSEAIISGEEDAVDYVPIWLYGEPTYRGVITKDYSYTTSKNPTGNSLQSVLFDRKEDPYQLSNLFSDPNMLAVKEELWRKTQQWMTLYHDEFYEYSDFMDAASHDEWNNSPFERPVDRLQKIVKENGE